VSHNLRLRRAKTERLISRGLSFFALNMHPRRLARIRAVNDNRSSKRCSQPQSGTRAGTPAPQCGTGVLARQIAENDLEIGETSASFAKCPTQDYVRLDNEGVASNAPPALCGTATRPPPGDVVRRSRPRRRDEQSRLPHLRNDVVSEFRALDFCGALHEAGEIVCNSFACDCGVQSLQHKIRGLRPPQMS